jgi:hypothetical protein
MESRELKDEKKGGKYRTFDEYRERFYADAVPDKSKQPDNDGSASFGRELARQSVKRK